MIVLTPKKLMAIGELLWGLSKHPALRVHFTDEEIEDLKTIAMRLEIVSSRMGKAGD